MYDKISGIPEKTALSVYQGGSFYNHFYKLSNFCFFIFGGKIFFEDPIKKPGTDQRQQSKAKEKPAEQI